MKQIETRKTIALWLALLYGVLSVYCTVTNTTLSTEFVATVSVVIGYYFGQRGSEVPK